MKTVTLSARFDGERIRLEEDYPLAKDARLLVTLLPSTGEDADVAFRSDWGLLAEEGLARAYGPDEPEYPDTLIRERNPEYEER